MGAALIEDGAVVETVSWVIRPPFNEYEYRNTLIHGMGPDDTEIAPEFDEAWWEIRQFIEGARLLAHNAAFDIRVLRSLLDTREIAAPDIQYACTLAMARRALPELRRHTLDLVCDHCGIALRHHDAASDAEGCARIAIACADSIGAATVTEALARMDLEPRPLFG